MSGGYWPSSTSATVSRPSCWPTSPASSSQAASDALSSMPPAPCLLLSPRATYADRPVTGRPCGIPGHLGCGRPADTSTRRLVPSVGDAGIVGVTDGGNAWAASPLAGEGRRAGQWRVVLQGLRSLPG